MSEQELPTNWTVYHKSEAGSPESHEGGPWFYQPDDFDGGEVWSFGYPTREEAVQACILEADERESELGVQTRAHRR